MFVSIITESEEKEEPTPKKEIEKVIGIDVGLSNFATMSDGTSISNPRFFRKEEKELARVKRKLSRTAKGSPER